MPGAGGRQQPQCRSRQIIVILDHCPVTVSHALAGADLILGGLMNFIIIISQKTIHVKSYFIHAGHLTVERPSVHLLAPWPIFIPARGAGNGGLAAGQVW